MISSLLSSSDDDSNIEPSSESENTQTSGLTKVFVCYSRMDAGIFAERTYECLTAAGYDVFYDRKTIRAGDVWSTVIEEVIFNQKGIATGIEITSVNNTATSPIAKITEENQEIATTTRTQSNLKQSK